MEIIAIIPARGGSKGIPRKNLRTLADKPLIAHTIECAKQSNRITRIVVSTDDSEIADVSQHYGSQVIKRPTEISGDTDTSELALLHTLNELERKEKYSPPLVVFLQCTSPLMKFEDIDGTIEALLNEEADSSFTATPFHHYLWKNDNDGSATGINHDMKMRLMRQQKDPQFLETGAVYVMRTEGFKKFKHRFFGKTVMNIISPERALEIDSPFDFTIAEVLINNKV